MASRPVHTTTGPDHAKSANTTRQPFQWQPCCPRHHAENREGCQVDTFSLVGKPLRPLSTDVSSSRNPQRTSRISPNCAQYPRAHEAVYIDSTRVKFLPST